ASGLIASGLPFARAGQRAGLLQGLDLDIVAASEHAGQLSASLKRLAEWHAARAARARLIQSRMMFPAAVFTLAVFVAPLPALVGGSISGVAYLLGIAALLLPVAAAAWLLWKLPGWLRSRNRQGSNLFDRLRLKLPGVGQLHKRREVLQVLESFELLYSAGVSPLQALRLAADSASNGHVQARFAHALEQLTQGIALADAFKASGLLSASAGHMLATGDASGRLTESLQRLCGLERSALQSVDEQFAEWLPRLVYTLVAGWMASQILGANLLTF
ncbi:MAG: type II secretion system F family protein, partial [Gammaproteobacteria bacterium]|nr:type II secretion system F family protein [Gammaproteobacteria bacterium]